MNATPLKKINNKFIDIEDIIEPGEKYSNWISIAKRKLRERELSLLISRSKICNKIIISSINHFSASNKERFKKHKDSVHIELDRMNNENISIYTKQVQNKLTATNSAIMCKCDQEITNYLTKWNGIQRATETFHTFPHYFKQSKKWWDQRKIGLLSNHFWLQMFSLISDFTKEAASDFFCNRFFELQHKYARFLNIVIINNLCEGTMKMGNSPDRLIIPAGSYKIFSKTDKENVFNNNYINAVNNKYLGNKFIRNQILEEIIQKHKMYKNDFQTALLELHYEVDNYGKSEQKQTVETETYYNTSPHNPPHINIPPFINTISNNSSNSCNSSTNMSIESNSPSINYINYSPANNSISSISNTPISNYINYSPANNSVSTNSPSNINTNNYTNYAVANNYNGKIYSVNNCGSIPLPSCQYHGFHNPTKQYQTQATRFKPY
eukprot:393641_1